MKLTPQACLEKWEGTIIKIDGQTLLRQTQDANWKWRIINQPEAREILTAIIRKLNKANTITI